MSPGATRMNYDVIVIGGGHNGLVNAAYLARAGRKGARARAAARARRRRGHRRDLSRASNISVCSYVVSLLRPEIIRELDLPRHGLEILPLDGTFTPMPNGDYLWRVNDHAQDAARDRAALEARRRGLRRIRQGDGRDGPLRQADPQHDAARSDVARSARADGSAVPRPAVSGRSPTDDKYNQVQLMTMSAVDFLDQWFETDVLKATMSASGIIGTFLGVRSPGTAYVLLHHYMGEIDGAFRSWGLVARRHRRDLRGDRRRGARSRRRDSHRNGRRRRSSSRTAPRSASCSTTATTSRRTSFLRASTRELTFIEDGRRRASAGRVRRRRPALQVPRLVGQSQSRARCAAGLQMPARCRAAPARRNLDFAERRLHGARLRRREVRTVSRGVPTSTS